MPFIITNGIVFFRIKYIFHALFDIFQWITVKQCFWLGNDSNTNNLFNITSRINISSSISIVCHSYHFCLIYFRYFIKALSCLRSTSQRPELIVCQGGFQSFRLCVAEVVLRTDLLWIRIGQHRALFERCWYSLQQIDLSSRTGN